MYIGRYHCLGYLFCKPYQAQTSTNMNEKYLTQLWIHSFTPVYSIIYHKCKEKHNWSKYPVLIIQLLKGIDFTVHVTALRPLQQYKMIFIKQLNIKLRKSNKIFKHSPIHSNLYTYIHRHVQFGKTGFRLYFACILLSFVSPVVVFRMRGHLAQAYLRPHVTSSLFLLVPEVEKLVIILS